MGRLRPDSSHGDQEGTSQAIGRLAGVNWSARPGARALVAFAASLGLGCASAGSSEGDARNDPFAVAADADRTEESAAVDDLIAAGPAYTPFDEAPVLRSGEWLPELLAEHLVPVINTRKLPANTRSLVWGLVAENGTVQAAVLQTTSGNAEFDVAAIEVATNLVYLPARSGETVVPVWILINVSMLLR